MCIYVIKKIIYTFITIIVIVTSGRARRGDIFTSQYNIIMYNNIYTINNL